MSHLPLSGLKVLDLTRVLAGPLATMRMGDLGADVIKIERTGTGDESRGWGPPFDESGQSAYYLCCNRNKLSVGADLANRDDVALVKELIGGADVVVDNFLPGALERRGLRPADLLAQHARLVWCTITGFGPDSTRPGYDYVVQAEAGWMSITGEPDGQPMRMGVALADVLTGRDALIAVLAALAAVRGGQPVDRHVTVSLFHAATEALINVAQNVLVGGGEARRMGNTHPNLAPYEMFHAADGPIVIAVGNDAQFQAVAQVLGDDALRAHRFATNAARSTNRGELSALLARHLRREPVAVWVARFTAAGVPAGAVRSVRDVLAAITASPVTGIAPQPPGRVRLAPPQLDEHGLLVRTHGWRAFDHVSRDSG